MSILKATEKFANEAEAIVFVKAAQRGNQQAMERIITANLPMIAKCANRYVRRGSSFDDLQSEGIVALMNAVRKFNVNGNVTFGTALITALNTAMRRYCGCDRTVRIAINANENKVKVHAIVERMKGEGVEITYEKVAEESKLSVATIKKLLNIELGVASMNVQAEGKEGEGDEFGDSIASDIETPYESTAKNDMIEFALSKVATLSDIERVILEYRFGLYGKKEKTYGELAEMLNRSLEGIRVIERKALEKLQKAFNR
jgi:RNA polymerase sigma factor (sigma-70 family)